MSPDEVAVQNIETLRRIHEAWKQAAAEMRRAALEQAEDYEDAASRLPDLGWVFELIDPEVEIDARHSPGVWGHGGVSRGREQWLEFWREWLEPWEDFDFETSNFEAVGDHVLMDIAIKARGRGSGVPVEWAQTQIWTFREGRVVQLRPAYESREAAVAAVREGRAW